MYQTGLSYRPNVGMCLCIWPKDMYGSVHVGR